MHLGGYHYSHVDMVCWKAAEKINRRRWPATSASTAHVELQLQVASVVVPISERYEAAHAYGPAHAVTQFSLSVTTPQSAAAALVCTVPHGVVTPDLEH